MAEIPSNPDDKKISDGVEKFKDRLPVEKPVPPNKLDKKLPEELKDKPKPADAKEQG